MGLKTKLSFPKSTLIDCSKPRQAAESLADTMCKIQFIFFWVEHTVYNFHVPYGAWSKVVNYKGKMVPFGKQPVDPQSSSLRLLSSQQRGYCMSGP